MDAATLDVIDPLVDAGELPNLARLLRGGAHGVLRSTTHPLTPQAWTTMVTGVNAARHGIWDFRERTGTGYELRPVNGSYRRAPAIWDRLAAAGKRVGLVNVPFTWPAPELDGFALSGFDTATHESMAHPQGLLEELERRFGPLALDHRFPVGRDGSIDLDLVRASCEQKARMTAWLAAEHQPDLLFVVFMSADHIHHLAWPEWERSGPDSPVAEVYRLLDAAVGELLGALPPDGDVLVVSDHGGGSLEGAVNLNAWLAEEGFLTYRGLGAESGRQLRRLLLLRRRLLPSGVRTKLKGALPGLTERATRLAVEQLVDLSQTRAFSYGTFGNIVVNLRGREAQGIVEPGEEYERVRDEIAGKLAELRSPDGEKIVRAVHRREDLFDGPELEKVPDLLVEFDEYAWLGKGNLVRRTPTIWDEIEIESGSGVAYTGSHRHEGLIALSGPSAANGTTLSAGIEDVAPTALYLLGEPVPTELEGRVLTEAIRPHVLDERPPDYEDAVPIEVGASRGYDDEEAAEVESRLRSLGYVE
ncbi:MAG TPA: alkaline phosphatase family protein [Gaiellaceae bacterium]